MKPVVTSAKEAVLAIPKGQRIFIGSGAAIPQVLVDALTENKEHFLDNEVVQILTLGKAPFAQKGFEKHFRNNNFFIGANVREAVQEGRADFTPMFLSEVPALLKSKSFPIAAALVSVTPPDKNGMCSLGVSVDVVKSGLDSARIKIAQINTKMPRTFGDSLIPYKSFDYVVQAEQDIFELSESHLEIDADSEAIGKHIAGMIKDGDVLQTGIGSIPNAVLKNLTKKNDLGVHTEMFPDGLADLLKNGNITNKTKKILHGRCLTGFCMGTKKLYDFVHENPLIQFYPSEFTNDPFIIAQNDNMVSINSALQVDLTGQVCADSIGHKFYSGIGGQVDFIRGASRSKGGRAILALPSTAKNGAVSRIVADLLPGAGVVTSRGDVRYVVTEFGVAYLHGKTVRQRALELIQIAHPKFRDELLEFVKNHKYVYFDQRLLQRGANYPVDWELHGLFENKDCYLRPIKITDEKKLQDLFYSRFNDEEEVYESDLPSAFSRQGIQHFVNLDYKKEMAFGVFRHADFDSILVGFAYFSAFDDRSDGGEQVAEM
ncbi:MAG: hypothetical protein A2451_13280, partial [Bdellovibrionales bacterium RIFOXYC2_FULL_39_8]